MSRTWNGCVVAVVAALLLAGCADESGPAGDGPTSAPTAPADPSGSTEPAEPSESPEPTEPTAPDPTDPFETPEPTDPGRPGTRELVGVPEPGVESGCWLLDGHLLIGVEDELVSSGQRLRVTGFVERGVATTCQQGIPFRVETAEPVE